jgi:hypothetical protein
VLEMPPAETEPPAPVLAADWPPLFPCIFAGGPAELHPPNMDTVQTIMTRGGMALAESKRSFPTESEGEITALLFIGTSGTMIPF